jgi:predicted metal-dependent hydrolase
MPLPENQPTGHLPFEPPAHFPPDLAEFWELWREEKFWACHEALEDVWKVETDANRKQFLQGLIHGAVAVFQFRRGNFVGATRQYVRAWVRLSSSLPEREELDVAGFLAGVKREVESAFDELSNKERADLVVLEKRLQSQM